MNVGVIASVSRNVLVKTPISVCLLFALVSCGDPSSSETSCEGVSMMGRGMSMMNGMRGMPELMAWMGGAELDGDPTEPRPPETETLRRLGERLFGEYCAACHGDNGDGRGQEAARLSVPARDLTSGVYKLRSTPTGSLLLDDDLFQTISRGMHGTAMLPWVTLTERDRWALVSHLKTLSPRFADAVPEDPVAVPAPPGQSPELSARGRALYERVRCATCHGDEGDGDGPAAPALVDGSGRPARLRAFADGGFRRGTRIEDIYLTLQTGLDGSPMPSFASALTPDETWALAAFVRTLVRSRPRGTGRMGPMMGGAVEPEERLGMMIDMPGMPGMRGR